MKIVHCLKKPYDVYIGRKNVPYGLSESKWHNPFIIGKDGTRDEVIEMYREYIQLMPDLMNSLRELENKTLGCWCSPLSCHGDVLIELVKKNKYASKLISFE